jgi:cyclic nucleotide-binding protein
VLGPGEFTGDVAHLTGGPSLASAVARGNCEAYEVSAEGVREILNRFPELGDVILQAFIARSGPGGQASSSMRIENYLGFPTGVSGSDLAERAVVQAGKFGARLPIPTPVTGLSFKNQYSEGRRQKASYFPFRICQLLFPTREVTPDT